MRALFLLLGIAVPLAACGSSNTTDGASTQSDGGSSAAGSGAGGSAVSGAGGQAGSSAGTSSHGGTGGSSAGGASPGAGGASAGAAGEGGGGGAQAGAAGAGGGSAGGAAGMGGSPVPTTPFSLNDVSVLFPLPASVTEASLLLAASDQGAHGILVPPDLWGMMPGALSGVGNQDFYAAMRVVAARIDPCFPSLAAPVDTCRRQVRLVFQAYSSLLPGIPDQSPNTADAGVHVFYDLDTQEFTDLVGQIAISKSHASVPTEGPLAVHPTLAAEGLNGAYATELRKIFLAHSGQMKLSRITVAGFVGGGESWEFSGFDVAAGVATPIGIAGTQVLTQTFTNNTMTLYPEDFGLVSVEPTIPVDDDYSLFFDKAAAMSATAAKRDAAYAATLRMDNPTKRTANDVSCVGCHLATPTRLWAERTFGYASAGNPDAFTSPSDLSLTTAENEGTKAVRGFGYRFDKPEFGQRVVIESAAVAAYVNEHFLHP